MYANYEGKLTAEEIAAKYEVDETPDDVVGLSNEQIYEQDPNLLAVSWVNQITEADKEEEFEDRTVFFNSESILNKEDLAGHFDTDQKELLSKLHVHYLCKKG